MVFFDITSNIGFIINSLTFSLFIIIVVFFIRFMAKIKRENPSELQNILERMGNDKLDHLKSDMENNERHLRVKILELTDNLLIKYDNIINDLCWVWHYTIVRNLVQHINEAGERNNFSKVLSKNVFNSYRSNLISKVKESHIQKIIVSKKIKCTITEYFQEWDSIEPQIIEGIDHWLTQVRVQAIYNVKQNLELCYKCRRDLHDDKYRSSKIDLIISGLQEQLNDLERRVIQENIESDRRKTT